MKTSPRSKVAGVIDTRWAVAGGGEVEPAAATAVATGAPAPAVSLGRANQR
jgi:hypothetical protein